MVKKKRAKKRVKRMAKKSAQTQIRNKKREISGQKSPMTYAQRDLGTGPRICGGGDDET